MSLKITLKTGIFTNWKFWKLGRPDFWRFWKSKIRTVGRYGIGTVSRYGTLFEIFDIPQFCRISQPVQKPKLLTLGCRSSQVGPNSDIRWRWMYRTRWTKGISPWIGWLWYRWRLHHPSLCWVAGSWRHVWSWRGWGWGMLLLTHGWPGIFLD